ncbi:dihydropyrimidinase [Leisingera sp. ANG-M1]|uniref:dihydropyrimidinase n=1 Tax=Leisingera sp. ANG-M1 TaxID=1577895 RepID=UPI00068B522C|nr:dihydropyrimidinase [Leisingera sp. ANG-M1]
MSYDLIIQNGTIATASDTYRADIGVKGGKIIAIAEHLEGAEEVIDASGKFVLPGGVEAHCHINEPPIGKVESADTFETGSRSAACGGNTTFIPFANQARGQSLLEAIEDYRKLAEGNSYIDYGFHLIVSDATPDVISRELPQAIQDGFTSFKVFMCYSDVMIDDRQILDVLGTARQEGALVMIHAENDHCISWLGSKLEELGQTEPKYYAKAHGHVVEREATHRAISLSEIVDTPILIVHVSSAEAMEQVRWAQSKGLNIHAETCPQYLYLKEEDFDRPGWEGSKFICSPPPREESNQGKLWQAIKNGVFDVVHSDHCPYSYEGDAGKQYHAHEGGHPHFKCIAPGVPGIEVRLPLMFNEMVSNGRLDINRFVALTSTNAAKLYGIYPQKGTIAIGSDADFALWDAEREVEIKHANLHDGCDYSPYEGTVVKGWPVRTILRGRTIWNDGEITGAPGEGGFLKRKLHMDPAWNAPSELVHRYV